MTPCYAIILAMLALTKNQWYVFYYYVSNHHVNSTAIAPTITTPLITQTALS